ncbi:F-box protein CPR1-like [Silene latifolia]|uniref:F-box protein CPR1-like n=1 Tax=Silene latifolia TaxID=37657 RepID=UPI003D78B16C
MASHPTFPDDIMVEILLKLPVKSILRCNTLSKHYYSLIHSQYFIRRHLNLGRLNANLYDQAIASPVVGSVRLFDRIGHFKSLDDLSPIVQFFTMFFKRLICGPVNGLYCVIEAVFSFTVVLNPATKEQSLFRRALLKRNNTKGNQIVTKTYEEAIRRCYACGFGYDDTTDDYKVVLIYGYASDTAEDCSIMVKSKFYILNVSTREWRNSEQCFGIKAWNIKSNVGIFVHGACHWVYTTPSHDSAYSILAFDMLTESYRIITFPTVRDEYDWSEECIIVAFNGFLGLVNAHRVHYRKALSSSFDVWAMIEYGVTESWTILHRVSLKPGIVGRFSGIVGNRFYVRQSDGWLVSYDLDSKDEERHGISDINVENLLPYEESLVRIVK